MVSVYITPISAALESENLNNYRFVVEVFVRLRLKKLLHYNNLMILKLEYRYRFYFPCMLIKIITLKESTYLYELLNFRYQLRLLNLRGTNKLLIPIRRSSNAALNTIQSRFSTNSLIFLLTIFPPMFFKGVLNKSCAPHKDNRLSFSCFYFRL